MDPGGRPREREEDMDGCPIEEEAEMLVLKGSQVLFTGLLSGLLEKSSSPTASLENRFFVWNSVGSGKRQCLWMGLGSRTCSRSLAQERCDNSGWWQAEWIGEFLFFSKA